MLATAFVYQAGSASAATCTTVGGFEIDGNMDAGTCAGVDWGTPGLGVQSTSDIGTYQVVKDNSDPSGWNNGGGTPPKIDFTNVYAFAQVVNDHYYAYVGWERDANSGTGGYAIEIDNAGTRVGADGAPQPDRSAGGYVFYITTQGSAAPVLGQSCVFTTQADYPGTCTASQTGYTAEINDATIHDPLADIDVPAFEFLEVGLDITALTGIAPGCPAPDAASLYMRSFTGQDSGPTGNLKGYVAPFEIAPNSTCVPAPMTTTATPGNGDLNGTNGALPGTDQHDIATVGTADAPGVGAVQFFLCNPTEVAANAGGDCATGGTLVPPNAPVDASGNASSSTVNGATTVTDTALGKYCWRAEFTPSANDTHYLFTTHTNSTTECFLIVRVPTSITTEASTAVIEDSITDTATLHGGTTDPVPTGTVTFNVYATDTCDGEAVDTSTVALLADGTATSDPFTPITAGDYFWTASYSGDVNNEPSAGECGDEGETSPVTPKPTLIGTAASASTVGDPIHDSMTLQGGTTTPVPTGTVTFKLYGPSETPVCTGDPIFTSTVPLLADRTATSSDFTPDTAGTYYWVASYGGDVNNLPSSGECGDEGETSTVGRKPTLIGTAASTSIVGNPIHDTATLSGGTPNITGTITFRAFDTADCSGDPVFTSVPVPVDGNGDYVSPNFTPVAAGSYYWIAAYSGDDNNLASSGACGEAGETSAVGKVTTTIVTTATSGNLGTGIGDTATLSGATPTAGGTITFNLYGPSDTPDCSGTAVFTSTVDVTGAGDYQSASFTPTAPGSYYWTAAYSGDENNLASSGVCGAEGETTTMQALAVTGAGPVTDEVSWALALLVLGALVLLAGKRPAHRRTH